MNFDWTKFVTLRSLAAAYKDEHLAAKHNLAKVSDPVVIQEIKFSFDTVKRFVKYVVEIETGQNVELPERL